MLKPVCILLLCSNLFAQALPDAPSQARVWDKKMLAAHGIFLASVIYDSEVSHAGLTRGACSEGNLNLGLRPTRGRLYRENLTQFAVITGFDWLLAWSGKKRGDSPWLWKPLGYIGAAGGSYIHFHDGTKWFTYGCL